MRTRAGEAPARVARVGRAALVPGLPHLPLVGEVHEADVGLGPDLERRLREAEGAGAGGHPLDERAELEVAGQHQLGVERRERGLEPGHAHRRRLERLLLLLAGVRRVVGRDAVDRSGAQGLDQREPVGLGAERRVHLEAGVERSNGLVGEREVVGRGLRRQGYPGRLRLLDRHHGLARPRRAGRARGRPRNRPARRRGRSSWTRRPTGSRRARAAPTRRPRA